MMTSSPKQELVSVIIPCYNHAHFLGEAIASVINQTYPHIEIIVVDDGSTDHSAQVAAAHPSVRYVRQENLGVSRARNTGPCIAVAATCFFSMPTTAYYRTPSK